MSAYTWFFPGNLTDDRRIPLGKQQNNSLSPYGSGTLVALSLVILITVSLSYCLPKRDCCLPNRGRRYISLAEERNYGL